LKYFTGFVIIVSLSKKNIDWVAKSFMMGEFCARWHKISLGLILYKEVLLWGQNSHWLSAFSHQLALISEKSFLAYFQTG